MAMTEWAGRVLSRMARWWRNSSPAELLRRTAMNLAQRYDALKVMIGRVLRGEELRARALRGGLWLGSGSIAEQAARFARNMVLARLLAPGAFGTMAIVMSSASLVESLTDVGTRPAVIRNPRGDEDPYLNASWWLAMGRAICVYLLVFTLAPWISRFYSHAELAPLLRVALLGTLFNGRS